MSITVVFSQMVMIFILMLIGLFLTKKELISKESVKDFSAVVINVCSPMLLIRSVVTTEQSSVTKQSVVMFLLLSLVTYVIMIVAGILFNSVLRTPKKHKNDYQLMSVFGNCGFIGIPVAEALFGAESLIYVAVFNFAYNVFIYTYGVWIITSEIEGVSMKDQLKSFINPGTISCIVTIFLFWFQIQVPESIKTLVNYTGQPATFLSLVVIGASLGEMKLKEIFKDTHFLIFSLFRFVLLPIAFACALRPFVDDFIIRGVLILMIAVPVGNMPAMMRVQYQQDDYVLAKGAIVSTVLSVFSITVVSMFI